MSQQVLNENTFAHVAATDARAMTYGGTILKTSLFFAITMVFAAVGWQYAPLYLSATGLWWLLGYIVLIALTFAAERNPQAAMGAGFLYSVFMGLWVGAMSGVYEALYDGIVTQALLASLATMLAVLLLYSIGAIRVTGKFVRIVI